MDRPQLPVDEYGFPIRPDEQEWLRQRNPPRQWTSPFQLPAFRIAFLLLVAVGLGLVLWKYKGADLLVSWKLNSAREQLRNHQFEEAVATLDDVLQWRPDHKEALFWRAQALEKLGRLEDSAATYDRLLEQVPAFREGYLLRATVQQRIGNHPQAIRDLRHYYESMGEAHTPTALNNLAYARALGGVELDLALADVEKALQAVDRQHQPTTYAAYADTRGYILFLIGRHEEALRDLDDAVQITRDQYDHVLQRLGGRRLAGRSTEVLQELQHSLAVMLHHRGLTHRALGNEQQAADDLQQAQRFGYNPRGGVY
jgi:tetratricopeptide (TPR) repeat protein